MSEKPEKNIDKEAKKLDKQKQVLLNDMFNDLYSNRKRIYRLNFFRGVFFGFGTFLGGTVVVAMLVWFLSRFIDWPFIEKIVDTIQR